MSTIQAEQDALNRGKVPVPNKNDDDDFAAKLSEHRRQIRLFIGRFAPSAVDGDDIAQATHLTLWTKRQDYDTTRCFLKWAFGVAFIEVRRFRDRAGRSKVTFCSDTLDLLQATSEKMTPDSAGDSAGDNAVLKQCIGQLDRKERALIEARYFQGMSVAEVASEFEMQESTTYKALQRVRAKLHESVKRVAADDRV